MPPARKRNVADPGCYIRTSDHLSVLVTTFLRRGKPDAAESRTRPLRPFGTSNATLARTALLVRNQNSELSDRRGVARQLMRAKVTDTREHTAARGAEEERRTDDVTKENRCRHETGCSVAGGIVGKA